ncbi:hypothetical protein C8Q78DRAFT_1138815 [Trametes maxima]|nr:hypothetical protein C8Q78DRAFT_1138815 [Trametes maxima]
MLQYRDFSAWITSGSMKLIEFEPRTDEKENSVTCWIAGPVGQPFVVHWRDHGSEVDSASYIYFDGFKVSGQFLYGRGEELRRGIRVGPTEERPFVFSQIEAADTMGDYGQENGKAVGPNKNVGSIILEIKQVKRTEVHSPNQFREPPNVIRGHRQEGDVCVRYGDVQETAAQKPTWRIRPYDPQAPGPYVRFIFRYRSRDWLISQGIIGADENINTHAPSPWPMELPLPPETPATNALEHADLEPESEPEPSPSPSPPHPASPLSSPQDSLGLLGVRPGASRHVSDSSTRSFSGTWDPMSASGEYEEISYSEYLPEDRDTLDKYYK